MPVNKNRIRESIAGHKRGNFSQIPNEIWELESIKPLTKLIWMYILSRRPDWNSSRNNVAKNLNIEPETASTHIKILEDLKMLIVNRTNESWGFEICPPEDWIIQTDRSLSERKSHPGGNPTQAEIPPTSERIDRLKRAEFPLTHNTNTNMCNAGEKSDFEVLKDLQKHASLLSSAEKQFIEKNLGLLENGGCLSDNQRKTWLSQMLAKTKYAGTTDMQDLQAEQEMESKARIGIRSDIAGIMRNYREFKLICDEFAKKTWLEDFSVLVAIEASKVGYRLSIDQIVQLQRIVKPQGVSEDKDGI
jgi:hypothetical protein